MFKINKRQKIIITSGLLGLLLFTTGFLPISFYLNYKLQIISVLVLISLACSVWALWEGLTILKALVLMVLPTVFTLAISSYYFLLPNEWYIRLGVAVLFGIIWYTLLLSQNVFNVSAIRTIPLYRVASTTVFVLTITTASLLFNVLFSLHMLFIWNGIAILLLCFPLILQLLWSVEMEGISGLLITISIVMALVIAEVGMVLSFWPVTNALGSVALTALLYTMCGISTDMLKDKLSREVVLGYLRWGLPVFILVYLVTSWTG